MDRFTKNLTVFTLAYVAAFGLFAVLRGNWEFVFYVAVVVFFFLLILKKRGRLHLKHDALAGLSAWGLLHMMGGNIPYGNGVLYGLQIIPIYLRYDQMVHFFGFGVATVVGFQLLKPYLKPDYNRATIAVLTVMIGTGAGALNEVIEFMAVLALPETGVGGYFNTAWDMTFNLLGAVAALFYIRRRERTLPVKPVSA